MFLLNHVNFSSEETLANCGRILASGLCRFLFTVFMNLKAKFGGHILLNMAGGATKTVYSHVLFY